LNSDFVVESRDSDFFELVDEVIEFAMVGGFWNFFGSLVDWTAFETA
jgi:hypothetical protein